MTEVVRPGIASDVAACAAIKNAWIDGTDWMPRVHPAEEVEEHYRNVVFQKRAVFVTGDPAEAYIALSGDNYVTSLFCAHPGHGRGKALLDHVKTTRPELRLWTFVANTGAQRFYEREGFAIVDRSDGDNEEDLPDLLYWWRAG